MHTCSLHVVAVLAIAGAVFPAVTDAQNYPAKSIRLIVPFPPGGSTDLMGRVLGAKLGEAFGHQVIVENRPGASGMIGNELVARATPDGYLLTLGTIGAMSVNPSLFKSVPYDSTRDFAPITLTGNVENLLVVPSIEITDWQGLLAPAKTPAAVVERLNRETLRILNEREVKERLAAAGLQVVTTTPAQFSEFIRAEIDKWGKVIRTAGIKPE